jgi:fused signal recognition particle receptor
MLSGCAQEHPALLVYTAPLWPLVSIALVRLLVRRPSVESEPAPPGEVARIPEPAPPVEVARIPEPAPSVEIAPTPERARIPAPGVAAPAEPEPRPLRERLRRTGEAIGGRISALLGGRSVDDELLEDLEAVLFSADLGVRTAQSLLDRVRSEAAGKDAATVRAVLRSEILERLRAIEPAAPPPGLGSPLASRPHVILVLGVNGSGKTTTIGKLAARYRAAGHQVILGAGDTFRAAASEQLQVWGDRTGCEVVTSRAGGDPAAVAFDALKAGIARDADVVIIDTAGRLQTRAPLMEELSKIVRVIARAREGAPDETLLVLDANTGQNALSQARLFTEAAGVTSVALTKLDGTAKGGVIVGLADEFGLPVRHVGVGEGVEDLREFSAQEFVDALFAPGEGSS